MGDLKKTGSNLPFLLILMIMVVIFPSSTSSFVFNCNGSSSSECLGRRQGQDDDLGLEYFLMESETRRILQQGGGTTKTLNPGDASCGRDKYGYLCTPPGNNDVKRSENCGGNTFNRACHQLQK